MDYFDPAYFGESFVAAGETVADVIGRALRRHRPATPNDPAVPDDTDDEYLQHFT